MNNGNFEFLVDQLREVTAERNSLRDLTGTIQQLQNDNSTLCRRVEMLKWMKTKLFDILKKRVAVVTEQAGQIDALKRALEIQTENLRNATTRPDPMDTVAQHCQDIHVTCEIDRLQSKVSFLRRSLERAREIGTTWRRRCQELHSTAERLRLENERLKLQAERAEHKASFIKSMES